MVPVKIVTDSTADLPQSLLQEWNIKVVPLKVVFGEKSYREGIDINPKEFYEMLAESRELPRTSQPSPLDFQEVYEDLTGDGASIISIHISSKMSGTSQSALLAKNALPGREITVIDSKLVSMALGLVVLAAAKAAKTGKSHDEIINLVQELIPRVKTYFVVDTLEYLHKGGRIGRASALLGTMLNIKPVLTIEDGVIAPFEKIRGKAKALERILEIVKEKTTTSGRVHCALVHGNALDEAILFHQKLVSQLNYCEHMICDIGAVVGTHAGPGTVALFFYQEEKTQD